MLDSNRRLAPGGGGEPSAPGTLGHQPPSSVPPRYKGLSSEIAALSADHQTDRLDRLGAQHDAAGRRINLQTSCCCSAGRVREALTAMRWTPRPPRVRNAMSIDVETTSRSPAGAPYIRRADWDACGVPASNATSIASCKLLATPRSTPPSSRSAGSPSRYPTRQNIVATSRGHLAGQPRLRPRARQRPSTRTRFSGRT